MEKESEELEVSWVKEIKEKKETPPDVDYIVLLEEMEHR